MVKFQCSSKGRERLLVQVIGGGGGGRKIGGLRNQHCTIMILFLLLVTVRGYTGFCFLSQDSGEKIDLSLFVLHS